MKYLFLAALIVAVCIGAYVGCGPRAQVAKDKVLEQIDKVLGDLNVKQASIQQKYDKVREGIAKVRDKRIESEVRLERIQEEKQTKEAELASIKSTLESLKPYIEKAQESESKEYVNASGRKFTLEELTSKAKELVEQHGKIKKALDSRISSIHKVLSDSMVMLSKQEKATKATLDSLKDKLEEIEEKKSSVQALRDTSAIAGSSSINDELAALNKEVEDMLVDLDVATRKEQVKLDDLMEVSGASTTVDIDEILSGTVTDTDSTLRDIDSILGSGN